MSLSTTTPVRSSANNGAINTTSDVTFNPPLRGLLVETEGRLKGEFSDGTGFNITTMPIGWHPMREIVLIESETTAVIHGFR